MAQQTQEGQLDGVGKDKRSGEPLFGPGIGAVSNGPAWTLSNEKKVVTDELTQEIVNLWIEKSKEPSQPTTTLQALVNLKRPTLRLSPLTSVTDDNTTPAPEQHHHGLEFEYDCDAPKCGIYVHVHLPKTHPDAPSMPTSHALAKLLVFETVVEGGFGRQLKLEEGALLELGRFEHTHSSASTKGPEDVQAGAQTSGEALPAIGEGSNGAAEGGSSRANPRHRRFTHFHFRKPRSEHNRSISGPALAVVDAEPAGAAQDGKSKEGGKDEPEEGVKITIRLAALDEQGTELAALNEQTTYLHIVRFGQRAAEPTDGGEPVEDTRPWVVRVVKREATIGPHTFHLHEIYGLTSSSAHSASASETAPLPAPPSTHTYPPDETKPPITAATPEDDDPQSECLLCLSSPREVVLLPCRHLVACKDCALNMVEFGAGGNITQTVEPVTGGDEAPTGTGTGTQTGTGATAVAAALATPNPPPNPRRKRKAKGWFCPVCRQPYTSMLRLTTTAPPLSASLGKESGEGSGTEDEGGLLSPTLPLGPNAGATTGDTVLDVNYTPPTGEVGAETTTGAGRGGGLLSGALRPTGFLRALSFSRGGNAHQQQQQIPMGDVENQLGAAQVRA
ncbi:hypothetical protein JR316_0008986 [Psilocybe cubensis]|uniref:Uncharacterized protein n=2 Tax=Psilocybe cubensis TaxID=181762 RepID=A0ACB8GSI0_PSICU|nr:hypothetical protein JR316_0008986 [Psilocybe cubensis]KAH9478531.1 hypothetical protein JR316_0008986 [Psilocybe cubensis]